MILNYIVIVSTRSAVQLTMMTKGAHSRGNMFVRKCADWPYCCLHYTHPNHLYVYNTKYCWQHITKPRTRTYMYSFLLFFSFNF
jgi:hypothetical protein